MAKPPLHPPPSLHPLVLPLALAFAGLAPGCIESPHDDGANATVFREDPGETDPLDDECTPAPPIDPNLCDPHQPLPPPPPINGVCHVEVIADSLAFDEGQGLSEGRAEASVEYKLTDPDGGVATRRFPSASHYVMKKDTEVTLGGKLATYELAEGEELDIEVCATFTEHDDEVPDINGDDDIGEDCEILTLHCPEGGTNIDLSAGLCQGGDCTSISGAMSSRVKALTADADGDCVENEDDFTPEPCDEANKGQLCRASLIHFHYGDGQLNSLVQTLGTQLEKATAGYDRVVMLIDFAQVGPFGISPSALNYADVVMSPTEDAFFDSMRDLTSRGCDIDTWLFSHGSPEWAEDELGAWYPYGAWLTASDDADHLEFGGEPDITVDELLARTDPAVSGTPSVPIRMTYGTPCYYESFNDAWLQVGAKVTSGSIDIDFTPNFFHNFADGWNGGMTYANALGGEYDAFDEGLAFAYIEGLGMLPPFWCVADTVLGENNCAEDFFVDDDDYGEFDGDDRARYTIGGPLMDQAGIAYDPSMSGANNMRAASEKVLVGNGNVRKNWPSTLSWP